MIKILFFPKSEFGVEIKFLENEQNATQNLELGKSFDEQAYMNSRFLFIFENNATFKRSL